MRRVKALLTLFLAFSSVLCAACQNPSPLPQGGNTYTTTNTTTATTTTTIAPTTLPTRAQGVCPSTVTVPTNAYAYSTDFYADVPADMLFFEGDVWHAVTFVTLLPPANGTVGQITTVIPRQEVPAAAGECNTASLVGKAIYRSGECLYTAETMDSEAYSGTVYRAWQKGVATCLGPLVSGYYTVKFEGAGFRSIIKTSPEDGNGTNAPLCVAARPAHKGFVYAGQIIAVGPSAAETEYGSTLGGLGRDLYASAQYPQLLLAGNDAIGYWVLTSSEDLRVITDIESLWGT